MVVGRRRRRVGPRRRTAWSQSIESGASPIVSTDCDRGRAQAAAIDARRVAEHLRERVGVALEHVAAVVVVHRERAAGRR